MIHVEIGRSTIDWDFGKQLLELFCNHDKRLVPQSLSIWSEKIADFSEVDDARPHWAGVGQIRANGSLSEFHVGIGWHRKLTTRYQAEIQHESRDNRGHLIPATLSVYAKPHKAIDWGTFANRIYELTEAQYGFVHMYRDAHLRADLSEAREATWITGQRTSTCIPQLGWSTFLGAPYAEFIPNTLERCDQAMVQEIGSGIAITLTNSIMDVSEMYEDFDTKRSKMKALFPENFFEIP
ncbi:MAG: hypothetical protein AAGE61_10870 [Pseudomonadota bacterium]